MKLGDNTSLSPSPTVSEERRSWMMSPITLPLNPISGCHPASEKSWGKRKRSSENFAMPLARTGRSHWTLLVDKWLMTETISTSTTTSKIMWCDSNQGCSGRFMLCSHAKHLLFLKCLQVGWDPQGHELRLKITKVFCKTRWKAKQQRAGQPQHNAVCTRGRYILTGHNNGVTLWCTFSTTCENSSTSNRLLLL